MSNKVICGSCSNELNSYCKIKKCKIKPNKKRVCEHFELDVGKVKVKGVPDFIKRPDYFWDDKLKKQMRREHRKRIEEEALKRIEDLKEENEEKDLKHPLTGDLSKFKTTASEEK
jgi:Fe-S-cluster containining protein